MDNEFKQHLTEEPIVIVTNEDVIEGSIFYHQSVRLSDTLKSPTSLENPYLALANATVTHRGSGRQIVHSRFMLVARSKITALMPKSEVIASDEKALAEDHEPVPATP